MAGVGGTQSVSASQTRRTPATEHDTQGGESGNRGDADWQTIKDDLQRIKEGLKKETGLGRFVRELGEVIERVPHASSKAVAPLKLEARLERIEALLRAPEARGECAPSRMGKTWANVAASSLRQAGAP